MTLTNRFDDALVWASELHRTQVRKGTCIPYISHLIGVASLVLEHGGDEDQVIAGLLHDSIEDQGVTDEQIAARYGDRVARIVRACTDADTYPKPPWRARKVAYIEHLAETRADALLVSLADKVHNGRALAADVARDGDAYFDRFAGGAAGTRWYYRRLADAFAARGDLGAASLLAEYVVVIDRFGATVAAASAYEGV